MFTLIDGGCGRVGREVEVGRGRKVDVSTISSLTVIIKLANTTILVLAMFPQN